MPIFFLALGVLGSFVLVPFLSAFLVWDQNVPRGERSVTWLGFSIGMGFASTVPLYCLSIAIVRSTDFPFAPLFGLISLLLGAQIVRAYLNRGRGIHRQARATAFACLAFGLFVSIALAPVIAGASPPVLCGEFGAESCGPGTLSAYASIVLPVTVVLGLAAWPLLREGGDFHRA